MKPEKTEPLSGEDAKAYFEAVIAAVLAAAGAGVVGVCKIRMSWLHAIKLCCKRSEAIHRSVDPLSPYGIHRQRISNLPRQWGWGLRISPESPFFWVQGRVQTNARQIRRENAPVDADLLALVLASLGLVTH